MNLNKTSCILEKGSLILKKKLMNLKRIQALKEKEQGERKKKEKLNKNV